MDVEKVEQRNRRTEHEGFHLFLEGSHLSRKGVIVIDFKALKVDF